MDNSTTSWDWETIASTMNYILPIIIGVLGVMVFEATSEKAHPKFKKCFRLIFLIAILAAIFGLFAQIRASLHQKEFKTDWLFHFEDEWRDMRDDRSMAATEVLQYMKTDNWDTVTNTENLDQVLDFFEDLGFYSENNQISDEILHQEFYSEMRMYCQPSEQYITQAEISEPAVWNHVLPLLKRMTLIESKRTGTPPALCFWPSEKEEEYLNSETDLVKKDTPQPSSLNVDLTGAGKEFGVEAGETFLQILRQNYPTNLTPTITTNLVVQPRFSPRKAQIFQGLIINGNNAFIIKDYTNAFIFMKQALEMYQELDDYDDFNFDAIVALYADTIYSAHQLGYTEQACVIADQGMDTNPCGRMAGLQALTRFWAIKNDEGMAIIRDWYEPDPKNPNNSAGHLKPGKRN